MGPNDARDPLLSRSEQFLYGRLVRAFPGHIILAQVALTRLLARTIAARHRHWSADFVVCRADFAALAVIEFEAADADREKQRRKHHVLLSAGIKVIPVNPADLPTEAALRALVAALQPKDAGSQLMRHAS